MNTKQVVLFKNNYYVKIKNNFYGPFHSCADADIRGTPKESLKLEKPLTGRIRYLKTVFY